MVSVLRHVVIDGFNSKKKNDRKVILQTKDIVDEINVREQFHNAHHSGRLACVHRSHPGRDLTANPSHSRMPLIFREEGGRPVPSPPSPPHLPQETVSHHPHVLMRLDPLRVELQTLSPLSSNHHTWAPQQWGVNDSHSGDLSPCFGVWDKDPGKLAALATFLLLPR